MNENDFLMDLRTVLSPTEAPVIVGALARAPFVWESLKSEGFVKKIADDAKGDLFFWSPAYISSLLIFGEDIHKLKMPFEKVPSQIVKSASSQFLNASEKNLLPETLSEAGLLAFGLMLKQIELNSWEKAIALVIHEKEIKEENGKYLLATLNCLWGFVPDRKTFINDFLKIKNIPSIEILLKAVLCQPLDANQQGILIAEIMRALPDAEQTEWLLKLENLDCLPVLQVVVNQLIEYQGLEISNENNHESFDLLTLNDLQKRIIQNQFKAKLFQLAGLSEQAKLYFEESESTIQYWKSRIELQSYLNINQQKPKLASKFVELAESAPDSYYIQLAALENLEKDEFDKFVNVLPAEKRNIYAKLLIAEKIFDNGEDIRARQIARQAFKDWQHDLIAGNEMQVALSKELQPGRVVNLLSKLDLREEAAQATKYFNAIHPLNQELLDVKDIVFLRNGLEKEALEASQINILLHPQERMAYQKLACNYEALNEWDMALVERKNVLALSEKPESDDLLKYADTACRVGKYAVAMDTCREIISENDDLGAAHAILGKALLATGAEEEGEAELIKATGLSPEYAPGWIYLANHYRAQGDFPKALEKLRASVLAAPDSAEANFALADACLQDSLSTEALPYLRKAAKLAPDEVGVAISLGETLRNLGHQPEAKKVVEQARTKWPLHPKLAYLHAQIQLAEENKEAAIVSMEIALRSKEQNPEWYYQYANVLMDNLENSFDLNPENKSFANLTKAQQALQKAISLDGNKFPYSLLLAEVLYQKSDFELAHSIYCNIMDDPAGYPSDMAWRVKAGFGMVKLAIGETASGLALLGEASQLKPDSAMVFRYLAEGYYSSRLEQDAFDAALKAKELAPDEISNLSWFANMAVKVNKNGEAIEALETSIQLDKTNFDLVLQLASLTLKNGEIEKTEELLQELLLMPDLSKEHYRKASIIYMRLQEVAHALDCLKHVAEPQEETDPVLFFELAYLSFAAEKFDQSLEYTRKALEVLSQNYMLHGLQGEILFKLGREQASLASLEQAVRLYDPQTDHENLFAKSELVPGKFLSDFGSLSKIYVRIANLNIKSGNWIAAMTAAERAYEAEPDNSAICYLTGYLYLQNLQFDMVRQLFESVSERATQSNSTDMADQNKTPGDYLAAFYAISAQAFMNADDEPSAEKALKKAFDVNQEMPIVKATAARFYALLGDIPLGQKYYSDILAHRESEAKNEIPSDDLLRIEIVDIKPLILEASVANYDWEKGRSIHNEYTNAADVTSLDTLQQIRGMVIAAEEQSKLSSLKVINHAPGEQAVRDENYREIKNLLNQLDQVSQSSINEIWKNRTEVVFKPGTDSIKGMAIVKLTGRSAAVLAMALRKINRLDAARQVANRFNDEPEAKFQLALTYQSSDPEKGLALMREISNRCPANPIYKAAMALLAEKAGEVLLAKNAIEEALMIWGNEPDWHAWAAEMDEKIGNMQSAENHWQNAYQLNSKNIDYGLKFGKTLLFNKKGLEAINILKEVESLTQDNPDVYYALTEGYRQVSDLDQALETAQKIIEIDQNNAKAYILCGEISLQMGQFEPALDYATKARRMDASCVETVLLESRILNKKGLKQEALQVLEKSLPLFETNEMLLLERTWLIRELQGGKAALPLAIELANSFQSDPEVLGLLALTQAESGDLIGAEKSAARSLKIEPNQPGLHLLLGRVHHSAGQLDNALQHLSEVVQLSPDNIEAYLEIGKVYQERREHLQALTTYKQAMNISPDDDRPFYYAGLALREIKDYTGSESMLRKASERNPKDTNIRRQLAAVIALNLVHGSQEARVHDNN